MKPFVFLRFLCIMLCVVALANCQNDAFDIHQLKSNEIGLNNIVNISFNGVNISEVCARKLDTIKNNLTVLLTMADAWSKFPSGLIYASKLDYGMFDECVSIDYTDKQNGERILGKHCLGGLLIPTTSDMSKIAETAFKFSYCVPDGCTAEDLNSLFNLTELVNIPDVPSNLFNDVACQTKENNNKLDTGAVITMVLFSIVGGFMVISTIYDVYLYEMELKNKHPIFTAFSVFTNGKKLFQTSKHSKEQVLCFHGIKFISMWWIIAGHGGLGWKSLSLMNQEDGDAWDYKRYSLYISAGHLGVDSFFYISGFLFAYLYFKQSLSKKSVLAQAMAVPHMILHRYLRLTPALLATYLYATYIFRFIGSGPLFRSTDALVKSCKDHWVSVFLYVQNYNNRKDLCLTSLWYLSADMQLFLITPLILIPIAMVYRKNFKLTLSILFSLNLVFLGIPILTKLLFRDYDRNFDEYDTHSRLIDYFIGFTFGLYVRHSKSNSVKFSWKINMLLWIVTITGMLGIVLVYNDILTNYGYVGKTLVYSLTRPLWCVGLCWIVFACFTGHGGIVNWILSNSFMQVGGKLTYCLYLLHGEVVVSFVLTNRSRLYFSDYNMFYTWCGHFIMSMVVATCWTLAFESPMITIEKVLLGGKAKPKPSEQQ